MTTGASPLKGGRELSKLFVLNHCTCHPFREVFRRKSKYLSDLFSLS
uniref:Uncharacterized protein n=1 Tax=Arundo donax TaxID=35708 RepID=A0A0A9C5H0_ARUDO